MATAVLNSGIVLEYDTFGSPDDPALLLVMGFTAQMTAWDVEFCQQLADHHRFVIRFDNRDCGLSTKLDGQLVDPMAVMGAVMAGTELPSVPYTLSDMAADAIGLLDQLGVQQAHVAGASMGGMIAQTIAIEHPERLLSVTSIMSTTGDLAYGQATPEALQVSHNSATTWTVPNSKVRRIVTSFGRPPFSPSPVSGSMTFNPHTLAIERQRRTRASRSRVSVLPKLWIILAVDFPVTGWRSLWASW